MQQESSGLNTWRFIMGYVIECRTWNFLRTWSTVRFFNHNFYIKCWGANVLLKSLHFLMPSLTWDSAVPGLTHHCDLEHPLVGRWAWKMSIRTGPCFCSLDTFHGFLLALPVFGHQQIIRWMEPTLLLIFVKTLPLFAPNFISQLRQKVNKKFKVQV